MKGPENVGWRTATRQRRTQAPNWLVEASAFKLNPSAWRHAALAKKLQSEFKIKVLLEGAQIVEAGFLKSLGGISRREAYDALLGIARAGAQREALTVNLEDAVAVMKRRGPIDLQLLAEIFRIRAYCKELEQAGVKVVVEGNLPVNDTGGAKMANVIDGLKGRLGGRTLSSVMSEWAREGWEVLYNKKPGAYTPAQMVEDIVI